MRHAGRVAGERLRSAEADCQLGDFQRVEETETFRFAAPDEDREGAACAEAVAIVNVLLPRILDHAEIAQPFDFGMAFEESADFCRILARALHPQFHRFQRAQQHPGGVRIGNAAHRVAQGANGVEPFLRAGNAARNQIRMAADIFGERIDHQIRAMLQRALPQRPEEGVVDGNRAAVRIEMRIARFLDRLDIDQRIGRVAGAFEIDQRHFAALRLGLGLGFHHHRVQLLARRTGGEGDIGDAIFRHHLGHEAFGRGVKRAGMHDHIARITRREHQHGDSGHAAGEAQGVLRPVPDGEAIFEDFLVRPVEARIDKPFRAARALAGNAFEMALARRRILECESAGEEDRGLERTFGQSRIEPMAHHQRRGLERTSADSGDFRLGLAARRGRGDGAQRVAAGIAGGSVGGVGHGVAGPSWQTLPGRQELLRLPGAPVPNLRRNASPPGSDSCRRNYLARRVGARGRGAVRAGRDHQAQKASSSAMLPARKTASLMRPSRKRKIAISCPSISRSPLLARQAMRAAQ